MTTFLEWAGLKETQLDKAAKMADRLYRNLKLDGLSSDAKIIKLALFVDIANKTGEEIELETVFKLVGGKMHIQAIKERAKALGRVDNTTFNDLLGEAK